MFTRVKYSSIQTQLVVEILFVGRSWDLQHEITVWKAWVNGRCVYSTGAINPLKDNPEVLAAIRGLNGYHEVREVK